MSIRKTIYECLESRPDTRNNDTALLIAVIEKLERRTLPSEFVNLLYKYKESVVVRERARLQNKLHLFEATDRVRVKRAAHAETKKRFF